LSAAGLAERVSLRAQDARRLRRVHEPSSVDVVVCNPPYGKRLGHQSDFGNLYQRFLAECAIIMKPGGRLVLLVLKRGAFNKAVEGQDAFTIRHVRLIETGRVYPAVFVLGKRTPTR
jgi:putative N6-adenine-specific DNA methylase/tRNA (guanine6-N2)-methyltransferase